MLHRLAPRWTVRRQLAKVAVDGVRNPSHLRSRVNRHNLSALRRFHRTTADCNICGHHGRLLYEMPDLEVLRRHHIGFLRESVRCRACGSKMRDRALAAGLLGELSRRFDVQAATIDELATVLPPDLKILETDAASRLSRRLADSPSVTRSLYYPDRASGESLGEERLLNVDLEQMPFEDDSFDLILTTEVMEHVRHVEVAHREVARCLRPGGAYVFTVPYDPALEETLVLIDPETDEPLVLPMHMHGDPGMRDEGIKSYRVFGRDIVETLGRCGLETRFAPVEDPAIGVFGGDLFVAELPTA
ncbi:class I SAM-dependent methyltransferase [Nocardioides sp.]|uniref:class I SAM-dependent methyltransferase n=1 Tax=Nocardioides sp. TaxID=35761 RepID=UPI003565826A